MPEPLRGIHQNLGEFRHRRAAILAQQAYELLVEIIVNVLRSLDLFHGPPQTKGLAIL